MAKRDLWNSNVSIPSQRRTAPQISPSVAKMFPTTGLEKVGAALFDIGTQMHQVNVARQVATALAQYKMASAEFLAKMQNADPSKVNFDQAFQEFQAQQGGLSQGVSRDASNIISNKIKSYAASTYGDAKRIEIRNTRNMALAEIPDIIDNLTKEQAQAELMGDTKRAKRAASDLVEAMRGYGPTLRPWEKIKINAAIEEALEEARRTTEIESIHKSINAGNYKEATLKVTNNKYLTEVEETRALNKVKAQMNVSNRMSTLQRNKQDQTHASEVLDGIESGDLISLENPTERMLLLQDAIEERRANGDIHSSPEIQSEDFYAVKNELDNNLGEVDDYSLGLLLAQGASDADVIAMRAQSKQNAQLRPYKANAKTLVKSSNTKFNSLKTAIFTMWPEAGDTTALALINETEEERVATTQNILDMLKRGDDPSQVAKFIEDTFEGTEKGVLEGFGRSDDWGPGFLKSKLGQFTRKITHPKDATGKPLTEQDKVERIRFRALMNLMNTGKASKYRKHIEAAVEAGWITKKKEEMASIIDNETIANKTVVNKTVGNNYIPFAMDGKFFAAPIAEGQTESDAILSGIDSKDIKEFKTIKDAEKFTGKALR